MQGSLLQPDEKSAGITFDPRTKMFLLLTVAVFVLGGAGGKNVDLLAPMLCALPFVLFLLAGKWKRAFTYALIYTAAYLCFWYFGPRTTGIVNFLLLAICGILSRFLPGIMLGMYLIETTTVSEFTAAMSKIHVTDKITIPLSVMFRFFPTVADEFSSINAAMRMRDIRLGGKNVTKMIEYRLVPLMVCSAKIGEELNAAALTRGLGGEVRRTNVCKIGFHVQDILLFLIALSPYVAWIAGLVA